MDQIDFANLDIKALINPRTTEEMTIGVTIGFTVLSFIFVCARFWIIRGKEKTLATRVSEGFLVTSILLVTANTALTTHRLLNIIHAKKRDTIDAALLAQGMSPEMMANPLIMELLKDPLMVKFANIVAVMMEPTSFASESLKNPHLTSAHLTLYV